MREFEYLDWIRRQPHARPGLRVGPGDDCAILEEPPGSGQLLAWTTDLLVDGTHFDLARDPPEAVGYKAMAVSLSDLAAVGYEPVAALAAVSFPRAPAPHAPADRAGEDRLQQELYRGLRRAAEQFACPVVGGDVVAATTSGLAVTTTLLGRPPTNLRLAPEVARAAAGRGDAMLDPATRPFLRSDARVGELLYVTGELGGSLLGRHLEFTPRLYEARRLRELVRVGAMIDVSDGLASEVHHLGEESQVGALVEAARVPVAEAARRLALQDRRTPLEHALGDGEDFELLFTIPADEADRLEKLWDLPTRLTRIGRILPAAEGLLVLESGGATRPLERKGYEHLE